ncbi:MAG: 5'-methylthioadenosine/adenosylhomocysteine nucleosidase [Ferruginibacter sp.]
MQPTGKKVLGILGAMPEEIDGILAMMQVEQQQQFGGRTYHQGSINGRSVVVVFSKWGKVAAAITATTLIERFGVTAILFTGVAGAINPTLRIGDLVIGNRFYQHDLDARPIIRQFEIPLTGKIAIDADPQLVKPLHDAMKAIWTDARFKEHILSPLAKSFNNPLARILVGSIASGDQFFSTNAAKNSLREALPDVLCVEMEGASVAQVCDAYQTPFWVIRTISDQAGNDSSVDFLSYSKRIASRYAEWTVQATLDIL